MAHQVHVAAVDGSSDHLVDALPTTTCWLSIDQTCERVTTASVASTALRENAPASR